MGKQTAISAKIDTSVLMYCKASGGKLNTLINDLLRGWMERNQQKQLIAFQVETGTDELSRLGTDFKCSQCCKKCKYLNEWKKNNKNFVCGKNKSIIWDNATTYCCIYWEKRK